MPRRAKRSLKSFLVVSKNKKARISPHRIDSIAVTAACMLTTTALRLAIKHKIPVYLLGPSGDLEGTIWSPYLVGLVAQRKAQVYWSDATDALLWIVEVIALKITRQAALLTRLGQPILAKTLIEQKEKLLEFSRGKIAKNTPTTADREMVRQTIFGLEGTAARNYWTGISNALPKGWQFEKRSRRPAKDAFNASLNYLYGMMYGSVELAVFSAGLDPYLGILHGEGYQRSAFTFDCIEPFRPWLDEILVASFQAEIPKMNWFVPKGEGWWLDKKGRAWIIPRFNDFLVEQKKVNQTTTTVRNHLATFAGQLAKRIIQQ